MQEKQNVCFINSSVLNGQICTSRPASVSNTVPRPPAVSHFWVEKPNNSMNNETAATHTAVYTAFPANWKPICQQERKLHCTMIVEASSLFEIRQHFRIVQMEKSEVK